MGESGQRTKKNGAMEATAKERSKKGSWVLFLWVAARERKGMRRRRITASAECEAEDEEV